MWRLLILVSLIPPLLAMGARWWLGSRVLAALGPRSCRADLGRWLPEPDKPEVARRSEETAHIVGFHLWRQALRDWAAEDPSAAKSRDKARRFGIIAPPFAVVITTFAIIVGKLHILGAFSIVLASIALAAVFTSLTLAVELRAVAFTANRLRKAGTFRDRDDEDAVVRCAIAHAWHQSLPPVLRWIQGG